MAYETLRSPGVWKLTVGENETAAVRPARLVMSEFAPDAAAPRLVRAPAAVVAFVPPWPTESAVVSPVRLVTSVFAPDAAA